MDDSVPPWVREYREQMGYWPPGWDPRERRLEPAARVVSGLGALLLGAAIVVVLGFVVWMLL